MFRKLVKKWSNFFELCSICFISLVTISLWCFFQIYLDGPYGAPSSHIFQAQHAVLIATGIGVTPFASILQSIMHRYWKARHSCPKCSYSWSSEIPATVMHLRKVLLNFAFNILNKILKWKNKNGIKNIEANFTIQSKIISMINWIEHLTALKFHFKCSF